MPPIASFTGTPTSGGAPLAVVFTDTSYGLVTNRFWDFGNGVTTNTAASSVSATYAIAGSYTVKLTVSGPAGTNAATLSSYITATNTVVNIVPYGYALLTESCTNGALDPDELVTVNLSLRNIGSLGSSNLVATLQASGGLMYPTGPRTYGALAAGGGTVSMPFIFVLSGTCGGTNIATLQLQDGAANLGTVSFALPLGQFAPTFTQNFDGVTAPALPAGWTTATSGAQSFWVTSATTPDIAPNAAFSPDPSTVGVNELVTPVIALPAGPAILSFRNNYNLEASSSSTGAGYDGGVVEIKIGAGAFTDIITAGGSFTSGGYNRTISTSFSSPLAGRQAWSGNSGGYTNTTINLPATAAGQNIQLKWRCGTDSSTSATGWRIDTISLSTLTCCSGGYPTLSSPRLTNNQFSFLISGAAGSNYVIQATTNLSGNYWIPIQTNAAPFLFIESNKDLFLQRFYRGLIIP